MDQKEMLKKIVVFNQAAFNNAFNSITTLQDQFERAVNKVLEHANELPSEGRQALESCTKTYRSASRTFKEQVDNSYKQVEAFLAK